MRFEYKHERITIYGSEDWVQNLTPDSRKARYPLVQQAYGLGLLCRIWSFYVERSGHTYDPPKIWEDLGLDLGERGWPQKRAPPHMD